MAQHVCPLSGSDCQQPNVSLSSPVPSYVNLASSTLSCFGSLLIIITYVALKDMRTTAQKIVTQLAVADFFYAAALLMGEINFEIHYGVTDPNKCSVFQIVCEIQAFVSAGSSMAAYFWTSLLAVYFFCHYVYNYGAAVVKLLPLCTVAIWLTPIVILLPMLCVGELGYSGSIPDTVHLSWCYLKRVGIWSDGSDIAVNLTAGLLWEALSFVVVVILYGAVAIHLCRQGSRLQISVSSIQQRLLLIPMVYILLRIWDIVYAVTTSVASIHQGCASPFWRDTILVVLIIQAIGTGGQGWGNCLVYIFLSKEIRHRMFFNPIRRVLKKFKRVGHSTSNSTPQDQVIQSDGSAVGPERSTRTRIPKPSFTFFFPSSSGFRSTVM